MICCRVGFNDVYDEAEAKRVRPLTAPSMPSCSLRCTDKTFSVRTKGAVFARGQSRDEAA